jgi:hypothetical protein
MASDSTQITAFVMDNATNNNTLVVAFERRCIAAGIPFSARDGRMRCMPHTIHLSALKVPTYEAATINHGPNFS